MIYDEIVTFEEGIEEIITFENNEDEIITFKECGGTEANGDFRIPTITVGTQIIDGDGTSTKYIKLTFGNYSKNFEEYVKKNGIQIHLFRYKYCCRRMWNDKKKITQNKKWVHPANEPQPLNVPDKQCWGFGAYQSLMTPEEYQEQIDNAQYFIANNGVVESEITLTYNDFKKGYYYINVRDLMSCIVKCKGAVTQDEPNMHIPTFQEDAWFEGGWSDNGQWIDPGWQYEPDETSVQQVTIMGTRHSPKRSRVRQPIKYCFAIPVGTSGKDTVYEYGNCTNEVILELASHRTGLPDRSYQYGDKLLPNIGFGVLIK